MKRKLLSVVISGVAALTAANAMAEATVYGKVNVSLQSVKEEKNGADTVDNWQLMSNASRFGLKGEEAITKSIKAIYGLEYETYVDDGATSVEDDDGDKVDQVFAQRNIYAGIMGEYGTIAAGKTDSPLKVSQGTIDLFNDYYVGDLKYVLTHGENRVSNVVWYTSPMMSGFDVTVAAVPGEESGTDNTDENDDNGLADATSIMARYNANGLYLALANDSKVAGWDATRLSAQYMWDTFGIGAIYQTAEDATDGATEEQDGYILGGFYKLNDKVKLKVQYGASETEETQVTTHDITQVNFGADYQMSKNSMLFAYYGQNKDDIDDGENTDAKKTTFGGGVEVKF